MINKPQTPFFFSQRPPFHSTLTILIPYELLSFHFMICHSRNYQLHPSSFPAPPPSPRALPHPRALSPPPPRPLTSIPGYFPHADIAAAGSPPCTPWCSSSEPQPTQPYAPSQYAGERTEAGRLSQSTLLAPRQQAMPQHRQILITFVISINQPKRKTSYAKRSLKAMQETNPDHCLLHA